MKAPDPPRRRCPPGSAAGAAFLPLRAYSQPQQARPPSTQTPQKVRIVIGSHIIPVTLDDNATPRDFAALLPLSLTLEDYAANEKVATLPRKRSVADAPAGTTPEAGDLCHYAPWGNLAIFHKPFANSAGLVRLGRIDAGVEIVRREGRMPARIEALPRQGAGAV